MLIFRISSNLAGLLPVDFLNTQWMEKSACYLPTYVPLVSGIFGLVWTTMFLMCSTGSRTLTGLQRPWRILLPVFVFSLAMGGLCVYSSAVTHYGLQELCHKLSEITGSPTCTYTVNVATLAYERRIRGVYQATRLTILSAWLHTACWLLSALLTLARVLLVVDFQLVRVNVELVGNVDRILERYEKPIHIISPEDWFNTENDSQKSLPIRLQSKVQFQDTTGTDKDIFVDDIKELYKAESDILDTKRKKSELSLLPEERYKIAKILAYKYVPKQYKFIVKILYDLVENINLSEIDSESPSSIYERPSEILTITRQYGQEKISSKVQYEPRSSKSDEVTSIDDHDTEISMEIKTNLIEEKLHKQLLELPMLPSSSKSGTRMSLQVKNKEKIFFESTLNITDDLKKTIKANLTQLEQEHPARMSTESIKMTKKSNLKQISVQTNKIKKSSTKAQKVYIAESTSVTEEKDQETQCPITEEESDNETVTLSKIKQPEEIDQATQTLKKEKQD
ncbi:uncharacterized protein LOC131847719 isoform X2 [Achroia grisella]|uniref:uncharacterized protein LOC131847719 isoform X2 n=1 Tax=Achroia grisella TaxID=688607 RepID=UPI0027D27EFA|nr:uncharacterized protein LOC131847719 isoform X2 [Achroia grisella]